MAIQSTLFGDEVKSSKRTARKTARNKHKIAGSKQANTSKPKPSRASTTRKAGSRTSTSKTAAGPPKASRAKDRSRGQTAAHAMAEHAPDVLALAKQALNFGVDASMAEAMANEQNLSGVLREMRTRRAKQD